ncbi:hypothetical protein [Hymenobacter radiodurans]|uniref:hypothetical protein n=1 Tax=Hymenobacter radiodurans TaxID=2496028 RepID=UPI00105847FF|nr:hypothetical protein [Hymenobacter radiodurans]
MQDTVILKKDLDDIANQIRTRKPWVTEVRNLYNSAAMNRFINNRDVILLRFLSTSVLFFLLAIIDIFTAKDKSESQAFFIGLFFIVVILNSLLFLIPTFKQPIYNYLLNFGVAVLVFMVIATWGKKK